MQELIQEIQKIIRHEIGNLKVELKTELKDEFNPKFDTLRNEFNNKFDDLRNEFNDLKDDVRVLRDYLFVIEHEHGQKIDAIYDLVCLDKEVNAPKFEKINKISDKVEKNQLHILNHEDRISNLEKNIS